MKKSEREHKLAVVTMEKFVLFLGTFVTLAITV